MRGRERQGDPVKSSLHAPLLYSYSLRRKGIGRAENSSYYSVMYDHAYCNQSPHPMSCWGRHVCTGLVPDQKRKRDWMTPASEVSMLLMKSSNTPHRNRSDSTGDWYSRRIIYVYAGSTSSLDARLRIIHHGDTNSATDHL